MSRKFRDRLDFNAYLLDANTLIDANRDYYGIGQVNEYWEWLIHSGEKGHVRVPVEVYEELKAG